MTPELAALALAGLLQVVQFALMSAGANRDVGPGKTMGTRDDLTLREELSPRTGRLLRAFENHFEGLILFTLAVVVVTLSEGSTWFTAACAWTYLAARVLYVPAYVFGLVPGRSIVWVVGFAATVLMILAALL